MFGLMWDTRRQCNGVVVNFGEKGKWCWTRVMEENELETWEGKLLRIR